jgi:hypothetical protein
MGYRAFSASMNAYFSLTGLDDHGIEAKKAAAVPKNSGIWKARQFTTYR